MESVILPIPQEIHHDIPFVQTKNLVVVHSLFTGTTYQAKHIQQHDHSFVNRDDKCSICMEEPSGFGFCCKNSHAFCGQCFDGWVAAQIEEGKKEKTCPSCRVEMSVNMGSALSVDFDMQRAKKNSLKSQESIEDREICLALEASLKEQRHCDPDDIASEILITQILHQQDEKRRQIENDGQIALAISESLDHGANVDNSNIAIQANDAARKQRQIENDYLFAKAMQAALDERLFVYGIASMFATLLGWFFDIK